MNNKEYINVLNDIRASEMRMALVYRRLAQVVTGPWRDSLSEEFSEHAADEDKHAELAMRRIVALGGRVSVDVKEIPDWNELDEILSGLDELEKEGVRKWQKLYRAMDEDDAFKHTIEEILSKEQEHWDEVKLWRSVAKKKIGEALEDQTAGQDSEDAASFDQGEAAVQDAALPEPEPDIVSMADTAGPSSEDIVGDHRRITVIAIDPSYLSGEVSLGDAWQDENGDVHGTGLCAAMLFEPTVANMYKSSSVGLDVSPLVVLAGRLMHSPFVKIIWHGEDDAPSG